MPKLHGHSRQSTERERRRPVRPAAYKVLGPTAVEAFLKLRVTNARTEGSNRVVKQLKRVGCGYRNQANYERRIVLHVAAKSAA